MAMMEKQPKTLLRRSRDLLVLTIPVGVATALTSTLILLGAEFVAELWEQPMARTETISFYGNLVGSLIGGSLSVGGAIWAVNHQLDKNRDAAEKLAANRIKAFTDHLASVGGEDLEILKAIGHRFGAVNPAVACMEQQNRLIRYFTMSDTMQRDLAASNADIYAAAVKLEGARENARKAALGQDLGEGWTVIDRFCIFAAAWSHMLSAIKGAGILSPAGIKAIDEFNHMYMFFARYSPLDQKLRQRASQRLSLPPIPV